MSNNGLQLKGLSVPPTSANPKGLGKKVDRAAASGNAEAIRKAAGDLEAVFLGMVFSEMAKTVDTQGGIMPQSPGREMFEGWFRTEVAKQFAEQGGTGLADTIARSLGAPPKNGKIHAAPRVYREASRSGHSHGLPPVVGRVTSTFGHRHHPVTGRESFHSGVDIAVPTGTPVRAPFVGKVTAVDRDPLMGLRVTVEHPNGLRSVFGHNSEAQVQVGQRVKAGETIALSGNTGRTTGPHLHFSLYRGKEAVDPAQYVRLK